MVVDTGGVQRDSLHEASQDPVNSPSRGVMGQLLVFVDRSLAGLCIIADFPSIFTESMMSLMNHLFRCGLLRLSAEGISIESGGSTVIRGRLNMPCWKSSPVN